MNADKKSLFTICVHLRLISFADFSREMPVDEYRINHRQ